MSSRSGPPQNAGNSPRSYRRDSDIFYTNEDIAILHEIVVLAEELLPNLPERERLPTNALFGAYYETLPKLGLEADHDNRYARILFKIGGLAGLGTLYERFEDVLSRMGIEIEFDQEANRQDGILEAQSRSIPDFESTGGPGEDYQPRDRNRRNSESTLWDIEQRLPWQSTPRRRNSLSVLVEPSATPYPSRQQALTPSSPALPTHRARGAIDYKDDDVPQHNVRAWLAWRPGEPRHGHDRQRSPSPQGSLRIRRTSPSLSADQRASTRNPSVRSENYPAASEPTAVTSTQEFQAAGHPSDQTLLGLMNIKALIFRQQYVRTIGARIINLWRDSAVQIREDNHNLGIVAQHHSRRNLLGMILATWYKQAVEKRVSAEVRETVNFFKFLEHRTDMVRNEHLLRKAFTHWAVCAGEQADRTAAARRHMLRWKTLNEWRELTVVKDLVVRKQVTKRFFGVWRRRQEVISIREDAALELYEENLVERIYREWMAQARDIQATKWWADGVKMRLLRYWRQALQKIQDDDLNAGQRYHLKLLHFKWRAWRSKVQDRIKQDQQAENLTQLRITLNALRKWRRETRTVPPQVTLHKHINLRLLRDTLAEWVDKTRLERYSSAVDRSKILREALTNWRHKLRFKMIHNRLEERIAREAMYRFSLNHSRLAAKRQSDMRLKGVCFQVWFRKWGASTEEALKQEEVALSFAARTAQCLMLSLWIARTNREHERESVALSFYGPRVLDGALTEWKKRINHVQKLTQWSHDANISLLASRSLKQWKASTESAKREKRKVAYTLVRRASKMNLARGVLQTWRHQAKILIEQNSQALEVRQNQHVIISMNIFDRWRARTEEIAELKSICRDKVLSKQLSAWKSRAAAFRDLEVDAIIDFQERQMGRALKRWSLYALQVKAQSHYSGEVREKNIKRTFRRTFMYWHQRAAERRPFNPPELVDTDPMGNTAGAEAWSDFGDDAGTDIWASGIGGVVPSTPLPGYLSTPSKRVERVTAAVARFSSTTPKAPLSTPFERHLRAQYSGGLPPSSRKGLGRSKLGMGEGFADIGIKSNDEGRDAI